MSPVPAFGPEMHLVNFIFKNAMFAVNLCKKGYNFTMRTCQQIFDQSQKRPRPVIQDRDGKILVWSGLETKAAVFRTRSLVVML